jgi:hypothetical protein
MERSIPEKETQTQNAMNVFLNKSREEKIKIKKQKDEEAYKAASNVLGVFVKPLILMLLWNWLMPGLFGLATIGYLKSVALYLISRILFASSNE